MEATPRTAIIAGRALPVRGDDIDTDRIIPARYLRAITFDGIERHVFEDDRKASGASRAGQAGGAGLPAEAQGAKAGAAVHPFDDERYRGAAVLLVNSNFGCGSSREHAPQAIHRWGIRAILGESFSDIFFGNAAVIGLPCVTAPRADIERLMALIEEDPRREVRLDLENLACEFGTGRFSVAIPPNIRDAFLSGAWDTTRMLLDRFDDVRAVAARLPYIDGFKFVHR